MTNTLIIGTGKRTQRFIDLINYNDHERKIIGLIDDDHTKLGENVSGYKVIGALKDLPDILHSNVVDEVVFIVPRSWLGKIEQVIHSCETEGVRISVAVDFFEPKFSRATQRDVGGLPLLTFESAPTKKFPLAIKRLMDILVSAAALIILIPVLAIVAVLIKSTSKGPLFFKQQRCGLNGRRFMLYKFRTMVHDAESRLVELKAHNEMVGPAFKMNNDPRVTKIGKYLRKFSLDELPQLWNVLRGEMSLVGPRPPLPSEVNEYDSWHRRRLSMRPGLTCLWQVSGRNKITNFDQWMRLDLQYIDNWSTWLDLTILFRTVPVVLFGIGAK
jgi:exopolysaccharide biosynthesis polyprenyl glycosylphosphotransferase